jgi:NAD(P)-dependent dehydrogenase (short-subunit alcohol dehydrogenase family)
MTMARETMLVTGANRGIGLALVRKFADKGWRVIAACRRPEAAEELRKLASSNGNIQIEQLDVTDGKQISELAGRLQEETIDILFNNAGVGGGDGQGYQGIDESLWLETFRINTMAPLRMVEAFIHPVASSGRRIIATMGSIMGSIGGNNSGGYYVYRTSKAAVHMIMKNLAIDLQDRGIIAVVFHPGWVHTEMGGTGAPLSPERSADGLYRVLMSLKTEDNGKFLDYLGRELPW